MERERCLTTKGRHERTSSGTDTDAGLPLWRAGALLYSVQGGSDGSFPFLPRWLTPDNFLSYPEKKRRLHRTCIKDRWLACVVSGTVIKRYRTKTGWEMPWYCNGIQTCAGKKGACPGVQGMT